MFVVIALLSFPLGSAFATTEPTSYSYQQLGGAGTPEDPYTIWNCDQLNHVNVEPAASYKITSDLYCYNYSELQPINDFTGKTFDGGNQTIFNLRITDSNNNNVGLFRHIGENSTVKNIRFYSDVNYGNTTSLLNTNNESTEELATGFLAGVNDGTIENIVIASTDYNSITTVSSAGVTGGLVGINYGSISRVDVTVRFDAKEGNNVIGGIVGRNSGAIHETGSRIVLDSTTFSPPVNDAVCGGIVGEQVDGSVSLSYTTGFIKCEGVNNNTGGLVGSTTGESSITESFHDLTTLDYPLKGAIVGHNPDNISLDTTFFAGPETVCDDSGNVTCIREEDRAAFYSPNHVVYTNWKTGADTNGWGNYPWDAAYSYDSGYWPDTNWVNLPRLQVARGAKPNAPQIRTVQATETTASFSWHHDGSCGNNSCRIPGYDIYQGIVPDMGENESVSVEYSLIDTLTSDPYQDYWGYSWDEVSYTVENLDPSLFYDFIIVPKSLAGDGQQSNSVEIKALPSSVEGLSLNSRTSRSASVQVNDPANEAERYVVQYKKSSDTEWTGQTTIVNPAKKLTIHPLDENTSYDFRVSASNMRGTSSASDVLTVSTTDQNSYDITSCEDLQAINQDLFANYTLTQDIDCTGSEDWNGGQGFLPIGVTEEFLDSNTYDVALDRLVPFAGTFDGQGHTISNLGINTEGFIGGLFTYLNGATVKDLTLSGGRIEGVEEHNYRVYTDSPVTAIAGGLAGIASNSTITNVTSDIDIKSNNNDGIVGLAGGLVGAVLPSAYGAGADATNVAIENSHATGDTQGVVAGGLVGAIIPVDILSLATSIINETVDPQDFFAILNYIGTQVDVSINNSSSVGNIACSILCAGFVGINASNLSITNTTRNGSTGSFGLPMTNLGDTFNIIEMFGPISAGAVGINVPLSLGAEASTLNLNNLNIDGSINGTITAGITAISLPSIHLDFEAARPDFENLLQAEDTFSAIFDILEHASLSQSFTVENTNVNSDNNCVIVCTGASVINLGSGHYDNVNINGDITKTTFENPSAELGDTLAMISMFGPITSGFVGVNLPISTSNAPSSLKITDSVLNSDISGTLATGLVALNLPGISLDLPSLEQKLPSAIETIDGSRWYRYNQMYGEGWQDIEEYQLQYKAEEVSGMSEAASLVLDMVLNTVSLDVQNTKVNGDVTCTILCSGGAGLSIGRMIFDQFVQAGNITNDNTNILFEGSPISMCPAQITGGIVGTQLLAASDIKNSEITGNISVNQAGQIPDLSVGGLIEGIVGNTDMSTVTAICAVASSLLQGTGGAVGSYISPLEISKVIDVSRNLDRPSVAEWQLSISNTKNSGNITSNTRSATGGLVGMSIGETEILSSLNTGTITNSTFAEMFRTPITSAATGGLVGHSVGMFGLAGNLTDIVTTIISLVENFDVNTLLDLDSPLAIRPTGLTIHNSGSTGDVVSSNTAGGLVGTASNTASLTKSYATGDVHGVTAGGLIGSGFNMGSPLGLLGMFSKLELNNTYARGDVVASDAENTFTFAGGLVGFMAHLGEFRVNNSYSTSDISVRNNATDTRLVAGGFVGAELDLSFITQLIESVVDAADTFNGVGDETIDGIINGTELYGGKGLAFLSRLGIPFKNGFSITNSFTTSSVPASTQGGKDTLIAEVAAGLPEARVTSGAMFGFAFSIDRQEIDTLVSSLISTANNINSSSLEGDDIFETELVEDVLEAVRNFNWKSPAELAPNSFYDTSNTNATQCAMSLPSTEDIILDLVPTISEMMSGEGSLDVYGMIPSLKPLGGTPCTGVSSGNGNSDYFKNTTSVAPLNGWDFGGTWHAHADDFPTFTPDPVVDDNDDDTDPPGTGNEDDNTEQPFVPSITPKDIETILESVKTAPTIKEISDSVTRTLGESATKFKADAKTIHDDENKDDSLLATIAGIMSATGMFLLKNLALVALLLTAGLVLWYFNRRRNEEEEFPTNTI